MFQRLKMCHVKSREDGVRNVTAVNWENALDDVKTFFAESIDIPCDKPHDTIDRRPRSLIVDDKTNSLGCRTYTTIPFHS
jgi:hypothetical protein